MIIVVFFDGKIVVSWSVFWQCTCRQGLLTLMLARFVGYECFGPG